MVRRVTLSETTADSRCAMNNGTVPKGTNLSLPVFVLMLDFPEDFSWLIKPLVVFRSSFSGAGFQAIRSERQGVSGEII
ncbi:MAG: hypothetical protein A2V67_05070 [Deltaproteobacteria bacterium RBG_13_61_14]|nr:MAG: hypothetical protein A2V67_05070 [Deltaproteobacteria bacterium RBG_13_61_14]